MKSFYFDPVAFCTNPLKAQRFILILNVNNPKIIILQLRHQEFRQLEVVRQEFRQQVVQIRVIFVQLTVAHLEETSQDTAVWFKENIYNNYPVYIFVQKKVLRIF